MAGAEETVTADTFSTKWKAAAVEKGATGTGRKAEKEKGTAVAAAGAEESVPEITAQLSKGFVDWILSQKPVVLEEVFDEDPDDYYARMMADADRPKVYTPEFLAEERDTMREMLAANKRSRARFERFQQWVRLELNEKGYVEVGESYITQCVKNQQISRAEHWSTLMGGLIGELKLDGDEDDEDLEVKPAGAGAGGITIESD